MKTDAQLQKDVLDELAWDPSINATRVGVAVNEGVVLLTGQLDTFGEKQAVEKGWVTLTGEVDWDYQRHNAEIVMRPVTGVLGVSNKLTLRAREASGYVAQRIHNALTRHAAEEARNIEVAVEAGTATLRGKVGTLAERSAAQAAAWSAPGISRVVNELKVAS